MFSNSGVVENYSIDPEIFTNCLKIAEYHYNKNKNPFHYFDHGFSGK